MLQKSEVLLKDGETMSADFYEDGTYEEEDIYEETYEEDTYEEDYEEEDIYEETYEESADTAPVFQIVSKAGDKYNVYDPSDRTTELHSRADIISYIKKGIHIEGVSVVNGEYVFDIDNLKSDFNAYDNNTDYFSQLRSNILPTVLRKVDNRKDLMKGIIDLTKLYCFKAELSETRCINIMGYFENFSIPDDLSAKDIKILSLFVLASVYYLTETNDFVSNEVVIGNSKSLGFKDSAVMFVDSVKNCELDILSSFSNSESDVIADIQQKLQLRCGACSITDYFNNHIYIKDLEVVKPIVIPEKSEESDNIKSLLERASNQINITVRKIMNTYDKLFSSAYQVVKPVGLLTNKGVAQISNGVLEYKDSYEAFEIYKYLCNELKIEEVDSRNFDINLIVFNFINGRNNKDLYFPNKLLEFAFGCSSYLNNDEQSQYPASSNIKSWNDYSEKIIRPLITSICKSTIVLLFKEKGFLKDDSYKSTEAFSLMQSMLDCLYKNLTPCLTVMNWKEVADNQSTSMAGFKIRVSDINKRLPMGNIVTEYIINNIFGGLKGDSDAVCESIVPLGGKEYSVIDIQHKFSPSLVNGEPLFAYTALNALKNSGKSPSWGTLILGKKDDDSILTVGDDISFNKHLCHWVLAGSRSGKGVMTLNILAGALASNLPVFYLDNKPDMASMFRSKQLSNGKMFCINGDYDASFDETFQSCAPEQFNWNKNIPEYIQRELGNNYTSYAPIFYLRAVMFLMSLIYVRGSVRTNARLYNALGGKDGVVIVIDEISAADAGINAIFDKNGSFGSHFYSASTLSNAEKSANKDKSGKAIVSEFGCYSTDLIRSLNESFRTICGQWKLKGLTGGGTEGDVSNIFIIGQNIHEVDTSKMEYIPTNENNMNRMSGDAFYNFLFNLGSDAFMGYNIDHPEYMWSSIENAEEGSKASTRLNATARNFAYVENFGEGTVSTMMDTKLGGKSSKEIADNAKYFKPFLIFNDADESGPYVAKDFKRTCDLAGLDFEKVKNMHRNANGVLEPAIGFIPYVQAQSSGADSIQSTLTKSYDIANRLVKAYLPNYDGDCIDFIYDLRPEAMFTAQEMLNAFKDGKHESPCKLMSEFFGQAGNKEELTSDYNNFMEMENSFEKEISPQEQLREIMIKILNKHSELRIVFTREVIEEFISFYFSYMKVGA